jgi:glucokinase
MIAERTIPTLSHEGTEAVLNRIAKTINEMAATGGARLVAMGVGVPGVADFHRGRTVFLPNLPGGWRDVAVADYLSARVGCPVFLLNAARMAALGELWFGLGRTVKTMVVFTVGTGVGGGVVIERKLRLGPMGAAGEIGHQTILPDGPLCGCGNRGCLETLASGPALIGEGIRLMKSGHAPRLHEMVQGDFNRVTPQLLAQAAAAGDTSLREAVIRAAHYLGIGVANVIAVLHPELVVLGGDVARIGPLLIEGVRHEVRERVRLIPAESVRVELSALEDRAGLWGGVALAIARVKPSAGPAGHPEGI